MGCWFKIQGTLKKKYLLIGIALIIVFGNVSVAKIMEKEDDGSPEFPATGFFYVAEKDGVWWYINSTGEKFFTVGCNGVEPSSFYYGNDSVWAKETAENLTKWGFNAVHGGRRDLFPEWPTFHRISFKHFDNIFGVRWMHPRLPDVFDPVWQEAVRNKINEEVKDYRDDPNFLGYELGNELKWGPDEFGGIGDTLTLLELYMAAPVTTAGNQTAGKQEVVRFFSERYDDIDKFNRVWNMNIKNFDELFNYTEFGIKEGWCIRSQLRFAKLKLMRDYPLFMKEPQLLKKAEKDVEDFSRLVAKTYFNVTNSALKAADPNHLNLGVRFHLLGVPREVLEECGNYCDIISINYYRSCMLVYDPDIRFLCRKYGNVPLDDWMSKYYEITGKRKPLRVCEYSFPGNDGSWPNPKLIPTTQKRRANLFEQYAKNCQKRPYLVGQGFWFLYRDTLGCNFGMVNFWDEPYEALVDRMAKVNSRAFEVHENSANDKTRFNKPPSTGVLYDGMAVYPNLYEKIFATTSFTSGTDDLHYDNYKISISDDEITRYSHGGDITSKTGNSKTIYVDNDSTCPGDGSFDWPYCKIQYAIDNSSNGDTIYVYSGIYSEKIIINKSITFIGEDKNTTMIDGSGTKNAVDIAANHVTITGFNITDLTGHWYLENEDWRGCSGIVIRNSNNSNINDNVFYKLGGWGGGWGIMSLKSDNTKIVNNIFYGTHSCRDLGIIMDSSNNTLIADNFFENNGLSGIWISSCQNNTIKHNTIESSRVFGILIWNAYDNIIFGNTIRENEQRSICLKQSNHNTIASNNFINTHKSAAFFYSYDNIWDRNYWERPRVFPKPIFGRKGTDGLVPCVNFDRHPLKEPYKP